MRHQIARASSVFGWTELSVRNLLATSLYSIQAFLQDELARCHSIYPQPMKAAVDQIPHCVVYQLHVVDKVAPTYFHPPQKVAFSRNGPDTLRRTTCLAL